MTIPGRVFCETHWRPLLGMQGFANEIAFELLRAERSPLPVLVSAVQRRSEDGEPLVNRVTLFNATDRRKYERELLAERRRPRRARET